MQQVVLRDYKAISSEVKVRDFIFSSNLISWLGLKVQGDALPMQKCTGRKEGDGFDLPQAWHCTMHVDCSARLMNTKQSAYFWGAIPPRRAMTLALGARPCRHAAVALAHVLFAAVTRTSATCEYNCASSTCGAELTPATEVPGLCVAMNLNAQGACSFNGACGSCNNYCCGCPPLESGRTTYTSEQCSACGNWNQSYAETWNR